MWRPVAILPAALLIFLIPVARVIGGASTPAQGDVTRGQYIVNHVAMCVQCHSPRDHAGNIIESELLHGAPMPVKSPFAGRPFAFAAPHIAGLPGGWTEEVFVHFLQTGDPGDRPKPQPPMPPFRMNEQDARAVAAYLKSLR